MLSVLLWSKNADMTSVACSPFTHARSLARAHNIPALTPFYWKNGCSTEIAQTDREVLVF